MILFPQLIISITTLHHHSSAQLILGLASNSWYCSVDQSRMSLANSCHSCLFSAPSLLISYCEYNSSVSSMQYSYSQSNSLSRSSSCMVCTYSVLSSWPSLFRSQASKCSFTFDYMYPFATIADKHRITTRITCLRVCSFRINNRSKKIQNNAHHLPSKLLPKSQRARQALHFVTTWAVDINFNIHCHCAFKMQQEREANKKKPQQPHDDKANLKKTVLQQLKALKPQAKASAEEAVECLVKQAEYYTNFLLSKHEILRKSNQPEPKKRGHFEQEDEEIEIMMEEEELEENIFTRLSEQPTVMRGGVLKYYQLVGLNWMISLYESGISGILADDMGLGKTIQTISILAFIKEYKKVSGPHIIIAPKITLGNWMNEFEKWLPCAKVVKLIATKDEREEILTQVVDKGKFDILVTSFEGVRICLNSLKKIRWHYIVIDEAHKIKNEDSQLSQVVRKLHTECKLLLTGTPLQNNLHQLWSLLNFLLPEIFSNSQLFDNWFNSTSDQKLDNEQEIEKKNIQMIGQLHKILKPFMLRRTKLEVEKNLPPKKEVHIYVGLTEVQLKIYKNLLQNRNASEDEKKYYLNLLMQLRKVCNHPYLFPGIESQDSPSMGEHLIETSGKLIILDQLLKKLHAEGGHKVLIFSQMTMVLDILEDYCNYRMYSYCRIDGSTDMNSRDSQIEQFMSQESGKYIFLLSTRAGGLGINLTAADTVVIYDSDFNPQMDLQAMDRAHRIGQKNCVNVYRLITENTVEEKIVERQMIKLKWDSLVIQQQKNSQKNKALTKEEMKDMLQYGANFIFKATNGTMTDELIDDILLRGESKTNALNKEVEEKLKTQQNNLVDFSMNSINIFDFMQQDQKKKREDAEALDEMLAKELQAEYRTTRRDKAKPPNYILDNKGAKREAKSDKKVQVPEHQFFHNKDVLQQLLQKEEDYANSRNSDPPECEPLNEEELSLKNELMQTGFREWSKQDFNSFITGNEKYGRKNTEQIAALVGKSQAEVEKYSAVFWARLEELSEKERIMKQIQNGEDKISSRKLHEQLLEWKASRCYEIEFNPAVYTKFRSKLFSIDADRFLAQNIYKLGLRNMSLVKEKIRVESMFRFDHFLRSRTESQLNKRMLSIYKLIEKEKDNDEYGLDNETLKETKKKQKKRKQEEKEGAAEQEDENDQEFSRDKKKKIKQTSITSYAKPVLKEEIE